MSETAVTTVGTSSGRLTGQRRPSHPPAGRKPRLRVVFPHHRLSRDHLEASASELVDPGNHWAATSSLFGSRGNAPGGCHGNSWRRAALPCFLGAARGKWRGSGGGEASAPLIG